MSRITHLVRPNIAALTPYSTARDEYRTVTTDIRTRTRLP